MQHNIETFFNLNNIDNYKNKIQHIKKVQIEDILVKQVAELLYKQALNEKNWTLANGFDATKFEKKLQNNLKNKFSSNKKSTR